MRRCIAALVVAAFLMLGVGAASQSGFSGVSHGASHQLLGIIWGDSK